MTIPQDSIGVVVLEPNRQLLDRLCASAQRFWGNSDVLPRQTGKELAVAARHLQIGLVVVRASFQRSSELIQKILLDLYAAGTQILIIQDTAFRLSESTRVSLAGVHFLPDTASDEELNEVLSLTLVRHCLPPFNRIV